MISVKEAKEIIEKKVVLLQTTIMPLRNTCGLTLAENAYSKFDIPSFAQSSMDGYAIRFEDRHFPLSIQSEIAAGDLNSYSITAKHAARIFTGAPLPANADTVVMQEKVDAQNGTVFIKDKSLQQGDYVRNRGAEIKAGNMALRAQTLLTPAAIGFLAAIGIKEVAVYPPPKVSIVITGNELQEPGKALLFGQVYESNSYSLSAALKALGVEEIQILYAEDIPEIVERTLGKALDESDMVLLTGGVSVGDYDFVLYAADSCGIQKQFHKINQKPGKPLYFGTKGAKIIFGLPGNPASVLTCFYEYVLPAISKMSGKKNPVKKIKATLQNEYSKKAGLTHFLKGFYEDGKVEILGSQASFQLRSFAEANCLIVIDEDEETVKEGNEVEVHLLPL